jgi:hypothetical protein
MRACIQDTPDLRRVCALPRRTLSVEEATARAATLTRMLALKGGVALRPWQGQILHELAMHGGVYGGAPVGLGKTLLNWLAPVVCDAVRPVLIIPGGLRPDVQAAFASYLHTWTSVRGGIRIVSLEELALLANEDLLERIQPDLIIIDEADNLRNVKSAACKRIGRYLASHPACRVCAWTGTPGRTSVLDVHHLMVWCLREGAPVPLRRGEAAHWAQALDEASGFRAKARPDVGALERLGGGATLAGAREAFRLRLHETPGCVFVDGDSCDQPIHVRQRVAPPSPALEAHFQRFRTAWETPDGWPLSDSLSVYRHAGELGCGLYLRWNPRPPDWWYMPRKEFCAFVRETLEHEHHLDTELAVVREHPEAEPVKAWMAVRDRFKPNSEPVWVDDTVLKACAAWLREEPNTPSLVWTWTVAFGEALAVHTGLRYHGAGGYTRTGEHITAVPGYGRADAKGVPSLVLSGQANLRGRNLQGWTRNLIVTPPRSARYLEQMFGRTHRQGQTRPVHVDVLCTSGDTFDGFEASLREASFGQAVYGITQKLLRARIVRAYIPRDSPYRWACKQETKDVPRP